MAFTVCGCRRVTVRNAADIGVNDMFYTNKIKTFSDGNMYAVDIIFPEEGTVKNGITCVNDIGKVPDGELDCVVMMDVVEHIENDVLFLNAVVNKLKDGATILITVPAYQSLFSIHDVRCAHYRRYNRKQLLTLLKRNDIRIERCHYFYTSLFLVRWLTLFFKREKYTGSPTSWKYSEKHILTVVLKGALNMDFWIHKILDKIGIHLPGLSLLAVCRKIKNV
jgi:hypothetical protein